jgi:hypothetical protein
MTSTNEHSKKKGINHPIFYTGYPGRVPIAHGSQCSHRCQTVDEGFCFVSVVPSLSFVPVSFFSSEPVLLLGAASGFFSSKTVIVAAQSSARKASISASDMAGLGAPTTSDVDFCFKASLDSSGFGKAVSGKSIP